MLKWKKIRYRQKIAAVIFLFAWLPAVILGTVLYGKVRDGKVQDILAQNKAQLAGGAGGVNNLLASYVDKQLYINNNYYIYNFLETKSDQNLIGIMSFNDYMQSVMGAIKADHSGADVVIYSLDPTTYNGEYIRSIQRLEAEMEGQGKQVVDEILDDHRQDIFWKLRTLKRTLSDTGKAVDYLCLYKKIESLYATLAITEIRIPFSQITEFLQPPLPEGSFIIYSMDDVYNRLAARSDEANDQLISMTLTGNMRGATNTDYHILETELIPGAGRLFMFIPKDVIFQELRPFFAGVVIVILLFMVILLLTVKAVSYFLTKRLEGLLLGVNMNVGNLFNGESMQADKTDGDEFGRIGDIFFVLIRRIKEYYQKLSEYEMERKEFETRLLQERFNPHFLYNTLSTIKWNSGDKKVHSVIDSLVKYYRIALNKGSSIVTVSQEMDMIREYLNLQKFAYGIEFEFEIDIEEGTGNLLVLKHLIQPAVENAVLHGLSCKVTGGYIHIACRRNGNAIEFEVIDNGAGIEPSKLESIKRRLAGQGTEGGYGIWNIQERLRVFYGEGYGINMRSAVDQGTSIAITIPCRVKAD